jgi:hypothetical protein
MTWYEACICFSLRLDVLPSYLLFYKISLAAYCNCCRESIDLYCILDIYL